MGKKSERQRILADYQTFLDRFDSGPFSGPFSPFFRSNFIVFFSPTPEKFWEFLEVDVHDNPRTDQEIIKKAREYLSRFNATIDKIEETIALRDRAKQSKGGKGTRKLAEKKHLEWVIKELAKFKGKKDIYNKIAQVLSDPKGKYKYTVSGRTVRERVKELGLLESA
jgi:hypothetical protein